MGRVTGTQGRPLHGVSQQPMKVRLKGQCTAQDNMIPDPVVGLTTRAGTMHRGKLDETNLTDKDYIHHYETEDEEYFIHLNASGAYVFSRDGTQHTVNGTLPYLSTVGDPQKDVQALTIQDTTILLNRKETVTTSFKSNTLASTGLVYCQFMDYSQTQTVTINGVTVAQYTSPDGSSASHKSSVATSYVADQLYVGMQQLVNIGEAHAAQSAELVPLVTGDYIKTTVPSHAFLTSLRCTETATETGLDIDVSEFILHSDKSTGEIYLDLNAETATGGKITKLKYTTHGANTDSGVEYSVWKDDSTIWIHRNDGTQFTLETSDDADGGNLIAVKDQIRSPERLPTKAPIYFQVKISPTGSTTNSSDSFWVKTGEGGADGRVWLECVEPDTVLSLEAVHMPHKLVRESVDSNGVATFTASPIHWQARRVGNTINNPDPSFVGNKLNALGLSHNRLVFLSGDSAIWSVTNDFFNFFRETTQTTLDTDPIDIYPDDSVSATLKNLVQFDQDLILFSEKAQYVVSGAEALTPTTAVISKATSFDCDLSAAPVPSGESVFFAFDYGQYIGLREFFTDSVVDTKRATPITDHVRQYMKGAVQFIKASSSINLTLVRTDDEPNVLYAYSWLWQGTEKVQSAWGRWVFGEDDEVVDVVFTGPHAIFTIKRPTGYFHEEMSLGFEADETGIDYNLRIDRKQLVTFTWNSAKQRFETTNPLTDVDNLVAVRAEGAYESEIGTDIFFEEDGTTLWTDEMMSEHYGDVKAWVGRPIDVYYEPSNPFPRDSEGNAMADIDRLQVGKFYIQYDEFGDGEAVVNYDVRGRTQIKQLTSRVLGTRENIIGAREKRSGTFKVGIRSKADAYTFAIKTSSHIPCTLRELEFDGRWNRRGGRI